MAIRLFVSHASEDAALARAVVQCAEACMVLVDQEIRCTSLPGYKLRAGDEFSTTLREELETTTEVIALLTPAAVRAAWVLFELGARWGAKKSILPLFLGVDVRNLPGPISSLHCVDLQNEGELLQAFQETAHRLNVQLRSLPRVTEAITTLLNTARSYSAPARVRSSGKEVRPSAKEVNEALTTPRTRVDALSILRSARLWAAAGVVGLFAVGIMAMRALSGASESARDADELSAMKAPLVDNAAPKTTEAMVLPIQASATPKSGLGEIPPPREVNAVAPVRTSGLPSDPASQSRAALEEGRNALDEQVLGALKRTAKVEVGSWELNPNADGTYDLYVQVIWDVPAEPIINVLDRYFAGFHAGRFERGLVDLNRHAPVPGLKISKHKNNERDQKVPQSAELYRYLTRKQVNIRLTAGRHIGVITIASGRKCFVGCEGKGDSEFQIQFTNREAPKSIMFDGVGGQQNPVRIKGISEEETRFLPNVLSYDIVVVN